MFFLITKSFGCQRKSFRDVTKENFDTCLRSVGLIFTEIWPFLWKPTFWTSNFWQVLTFFSWVKMHGSHGKWHNSVIMRSSDLGQVSKFSLVTSLKLFLWHPKDSVIRKNIYVFVEPKISWVRPNLQILWFIRMQWVSKEMA